MDAEIREKFEDLVNALSPENLSCDGEASKAEQKIRYQRLMKQWHDLEKQVGREVSEDEIWEDILKRLY